MWVSEGGKGYGTQLINKWIEDAKKLSKKGVVDVTNAKTSWAPSQDIFLTNPFEVVDTAPYGFELLAYIFTNETLNPYFPNDWDDRVKKFHNLKILRSFQCPYVAIATENLVAAADKVKLQSVGVFFISH
ncbi:GNAT family N-acetyltransferase [Lysinibacillus sphaericus]|uniref:N-acetyltransferase GCN5 n=1 Tax=Lysinibacillus sphaericus OT4b.31 TaxID=1285586 RepID=R7Z803_LYSSH|nr:GNAT family N-acetyltransferase [Lysinibacillus sphaericus]EON70282.1 N-acetyltransferase GCN5 [Lysinibacillus sphaericus OT4b.31]